MLRTFLSRGHGLLRRRSLDQQLEEEVRFHLEMEAAKNRNRGMSSEDALAGARRAFGGSEQIKEIYRKQRGLPMIETAMQDLQYALRGFRRSPGFAALVVLSLAMGIGANTAIFTLIDVVMLRSLPVRAPDQLVTIGDASRPTAYLVGGPMANVFSYPLYQRVRDENTVFSSLLASGKTGNLDVEIRGGTKEDAHGRLVSSNYFDVLGISPFAGHSFSPQEDRAAGSNPVAVISYDYWVNRFGRNLDVLGTT